MAISDVQQYMHLSDEEIELLGTELDAIRKEVEDSRGAADAAYINRLIRIQRYLAVAGRVTLMLGTQTKKSRVPAAVVGGTLLGLHKILENMEIGHNVMHGQWDWMNDPNIHSSTWDWDTASPAAAWKHSHNYVHHTFTNIVGKDKDVGYEIMRVDPKQDWEPRFLAQPVVNVLLMLAFEWGVALHDLDLEAVRKGTKSPKMLLADLKGIRGKMIRQVVKDYIAFPALSGPKGFKATLWANVTANVVRNIWSNAII
ncbi:MAG: acyl-CoA desaturase, partial [Marmoricola sp.]|nr:acyl-CoA desaturase [Marmoricola sp.]